MIGVFSSQAYNLILLAEDEARMLGRASVEPEHLLLALARSGNVVSLLQRRGVSAVDIHGAIVAAGGFGDDLALGALQRSAAVEDAMERAIDAAADRGVAGPSSEHLLLGLGDDAAVASILRELGITDVEALVDEVYPARSKPLDREKVRRHALRVASSQTPPFPGPVPPAFERFTAQARAAVEAAIRSADELANAYVAPFHFLLGFLAVGEGLAATVLEQHGLTLSVARKMAQVYGPGPANQATGIFTQTARRIVAEDALLRAYRHGHHSIGTGHILLASLDCPENLTALAVLRRPSLPERIVLAQHIARETTRLLPGDEATDWSG